MALLNWWREGTDQRALLAQGRTGGLPDQATGRLRMVLDLLEADSGLRGRFQESVAAILLEAHGVNLFADAGIPSDRGFLSEFGDRLADKIVPAPRDDHDLARLLRRIYRSAYHVERVRRLDSALFDRFLRLLAPVDRPELWNSMRGDFADGFQLLAAKVQAHGLMRDVRSRSGRQKVGESPFYRFEKASEALAARWIAGGDLEQATLDWRRAAAECRGEMEEIYQRLNTHGVNVNVVYALRVIQLCLDRMQNMVEIMTRDALNRTAKWLHQHWGGRRMRADTLHITLAFLGSTPAEQLDTLAACADAARTDAFELLLDQAGYWRHNRIGWFGASETPPQHFELMGALNAA